MATVAQHLKNSGSLLESLEAIKNFRAYITLAAGGIASGIVFAMSMFFFAKLNMTGMATVVAGIGILIAAVIFLTGLSATGVLLMDQAKGNESRSVGSALFAGLVTLPSMIGMYLLLALIMVAVLAVLAIILFVCKIPGIGPLLYALVFPISAVLMGGLFFAYVNVIAPLSMPAIWDGNGIVQVVGKLFALARTNLLTVIIFQILLLLIVGLTSAVAFGILAYGLFTVTPLSAMILPSGDPSELMNSLFGMMSGRFGGDGGGYIAAAGFGTAVLFMVAAAVPLLTLIMGNCIIYLNFVRNQETEQFEATVRGKMSEFKEKAAETRNQLAQQAASLKQPAPLVKPSCAKCGQPIAEDELFCGNCGNKLK